MSRDERWTFICVKIGRLNLIAAVVEFGTPNRVAVCGDDWLGIHPKIGTLDVIAAIIEFGMPAKIPLAKRRHSICAEPFRLHPIPKRIVFVSYPSKSVLLLSEIAASVKVRQLQLISSRIELLTPMVTIVSERWVAINAKIESFLFISKTIKLQRPTRIASVNEHFFTTRIKITGLNKVTRLAV